MSRIAISAQQISKRYNIGTKHHGYRTVRESLSRAATAPLRAITRRKSSGKENSEARTVWALRDISFEIQPGEVVGVIGRNGAGKSTLLKVLSRITEPTTGCADLYGRLGSLLEVGTGFHGELSGRENIYLNGAILGMKRMDIDRQFDRIVAFAEVERFIDTPVKHYSTGMYMRLAFAVAAHLDPEILLVDEVLAVGDVAFQRKCLGRIGEVAADGRTVLFVSHNMGAVRSLCSKGLVLDSGRVAYFGNIGKSIESYFKLAGAASVRTADDGSPIAGFGPISITGNEGTIEQGDALEINTELRVPTETASFTLLCLLEDSSQRNIFHLRMDSGDCKSHGSLRNNYAIRLRIPPLWLEPGIYSLWFKALYSGASVQSRVISDIFHVDVSGKSSGWNAVLSPKAEWSLEPSDIDQLEMERSACSQFGGT
jgi:lipopolysaccharide transport system ATP-binding protein